MAEAGDILKPVPKEIKIKEPIGPVILGKVDPGSLTPEEFSQSAELLFHGSARPFEFKRGFDYQGAEYLADTDGSQTLGVGFYTTDAKSEAANYSVVRNHQNVEQPVVIEVLPYQAKMLDLRAKDDQSDNGSFPRDLAIKWRQRFLDYLKTRKPRDGNIGLIFNNLEHEYGDDYLARVIAGDSIDLRVLLNTKRSAIKGSHGMPSPPWSQLFSDFMLEQGFDGVVYIEGGEGQSRTSNPSFVFYNLEKIGDYKSWQTQNKQL